MRHWFDEGSAQSRDYCALHHPPRGFRCEKYFAGEVLVPYYLIGRAEFVRFEIRRAKMAWKAPKIVEVPVGMEINMYACAARK
jgi:coenzyme PQQ precursor peptide PqqA